ncbi:MAG: glucose-1-phosphate cytidylyltransferase [Planctomycetes bacterium]|nr:glucose-1-phosphate cytidylyltransferase [Planctomycetota bacterium]
MKVVLFCGGLGMRLRDYSDKVPKPMVEIGYRPILWHVMKYYAAYGHTDFILCLGYKADYIKDYFVNYDEYVSNDFVLQKGGEMKLLNTDIKEWNITFCDTGISTCIGERLRRVREHLKGEEMFLANYSDNLTDFHLPDMIDAVKGSNAVAGFVAVKPPHSFHVVDIGTDTQVKELRETRHSDLWVNGGYFVLRPEIFDYMNKDEELVIEPFSRLIQENRLIAMKYEGFWQNMDTFKDRTLLHEMHTEGNAPWQIWNR